MRVTTSFAWLTLAAFFVAAPFAAAQEFPAKPVRLIVPFPPGGAVDILARSISNPMSKSLGQTVIVENRPGANTVIGAELVARAPADGHTLLLMAPSFTINQFVRSKLPYDSVRDFAGVTLMASGALLIAVHPSVPAKNTKELVALAKANPGKLTYATASVIGGQRLAAELFKDAAKIDIVNVPYNGGAPATMAVVGGHTTMLVTNIIEAAPGDRRKAPGHRRDDHQALGSTAGGADRRGSGLCGVRCGQLVRRRRSHRRAENGDRSPQYRHFAGPRPSGSSRDIAQAGPHARIHERGCLQRVPAEGNGTNGPCGKDAEPQDGLAVR